MVNSSSDVCVKIWLNPDDHLVHAADTLAALLIEAHEAILAPPGSPGVLNLPVDLALLGERGLPVAIGEAKGVITHHFHLGFTYRVVIVADKSDSVIERVRVAPTVSKSDGGIQDALAIEAPLRVVGGHSDAQGTNLKPLFDVVETTCHLSEIRNFGDLVVCHTSILVAQVRFRSLRAPAVGLGILVWVNFGCGLAMVPGEHPGVEVPATIAALRAVGLLSKLHVVVIGVSRAVDKLLLRQSHGLVACHGGNSALEH